MKGCYLHMPCFFFCWFCVCWRLLASTKCILHHLHHWHNNCLGRQQNLFLYRVSYRQNSEINLSLLYNIFRFYHKYFPNTIVSDRLKGHEPCSLLSSFVELQPGTDSADDW